MRSLLKELPEFEKIYRGFAHAKVKVLLVSLYFPAQPEQGLNSFLKTNPITAIAKTTAGFSAGSAVDTT
jgi:hypothetical protein